MKPFNCACGNRVYFENTQCVSCTKALGWCPYCNTLTALLPLDSGEFQCGHSSCGARLVKCHNYEVESVCNRCCKIPSKAKSLLPLCNYCRFNETIPDLKVPGNREMWGRLEAAKRRLLYTLDLLSLPYGNADDGIQPPLKFDFKADTTQKSRWWWSLGKEERVYTGHAKGKITINVREADTVEREKARVLFQEAHRTVIGHFRHEIAHYYWEMFVLGRREAEFKSVFGDHETPGYPQSQERYYKVGPIPNWQSRYVSAYATMHPWEDFAETFATYLDMVSVLDTAWHVGIADSCDPTSANIKEMVEKYIKLGVVFNELNRAMGLIDLVPEIIGPPVAAKLRYVHELLRTSIGASKTAKATPAR